MCLCVASLLLLLEMLCVCVCVRALLCDNEWLTYTHTKQNLPNEPKIDQLDLKQEVFSDLYLVGISSFVYF